MRKMMVTLASSAAALVVSAGFAVNSNAQDFAQDQAYCRQLVDEYMMGGTNRGGFAPESLDLSVAIDQCRSGNPEPAIPVLQRRLRDAGFTVPPRT